MMPSYHGRLILTLLIPHYWLYFLMYFIPIYAAFTIMVWIGYFLQIAIRRTAWGRKESQDKCIAKALSN